MYVYQLIQVTLIHFNLKNIIYIFEMIIKYLYTV